MPSTRFQKHLPYSANDLIAFVSDVEKYPKFINVIAAIRIIGAKARSAHGESFEAEMRVAYRVFSESVRCQVDVNRQDNTVSVRNSVKSGALKNLKNDWKFHTLSDGTTFLDFNVDVTLKSAALNFLARQKFNSVAEKIMDVFLVRAAQVCTKIDSDKDMSAEIAALGAEQLV